MSDFLLSDDKISIFADKLSMVDPRERTGEKIEEILGIVIPNAVRLPKDKKWFDLRVGTDGIESKTFLYKKVAQKAYVDNVLKRVSQVKAKQGSHLKLASQVGSAILDYLNNSVKLHASNKGISGKKILSVLARDIDDIHFAYWELPLDFGQGNNYEWSWQGKETLVGIKNKVRIFNWYQNQKQLFYRWEIPPNAVFFEAPKYDNFKISRTEYNERIKESYLNGYKNGKDRKKSDY